MPPTRSGESTRTADIVRKLKQNEPAARASLYEEYAGLVYSFCLRTLRDRAHAEDATHDTFVMMFRDIHQLKDPERLRSWIFTIARNRMLMFIRARKRVDPLTDDIVADDSPLDIVIGRDLNARIDDAISRLPGDDRQMIYLRDVVGLSYREIADVTKRSHSAVKSAIFRARRTLIQKLRLLLDKE